jgi:hypothetical protein
MHHCHARQSRSDFAGDDVDNLLDLNPQAIREHHPISIAHEHVRGQRVHYQLHVFAVTTPVPALHHLHGNKQPNIYDPHGCHVDEEKADGAHATQHEVGMNSTQRATQRNRTRTGHDSIGQGCTVATNQITSRTVPPQRGAAENAWGEGGGGIATAWREKTAFLSVDHLHVQKME